MFSFSRSRAIALFLLLFIVAVIPIGLMLAQQRQTVSTKAQEFDPGPGGGGGGVTNPNPNPNAGDGTGTGNASDIKVHSCQGHNLELSTEIQGKKQVFVSIPNPVCLSGITGVNRFAIITVELLLIGAVLISFFWLIRGGIQYIISQGDPKAIAEARSRVTYAIIGLAVAFFALFIFNIVGFVVGYSLLTPSLGEQIGDAVKREQDLMTQQCEDKALKGRVSYETCFIQYCDSKYKQPEQAQQRQDCIDLGNGILDSAMKKAVQNQLRGWADDCKNSGAPDIVKCVQQRCDIQYNNDPKTRQDCRDLAPGI